MPKPKLGKGIDQDGGEQQDKHFQLKTSNYQPTKAELEEDLSVPVSLEQLAQAALSGGAKWRKRS